MSHAETELAPIRPDEDFDHERLATWLRERLPAVGAPASGPMEVLQFPGGHSNLTYRVRFAGEGAGSPSAEYVVRRPPLGPVAPKAHDMGREFACLSKLSLSFSRAPRAYLFCEDPAVLGAPFLVMERRCGHVLRDRWPEEWGEDEALRRRISESLVDTLAELHAIDPASVGLGDFGKPEGFVERQIEGWAGRWEKAKTRELPVVDEVVAWLRANRPASQRSSIVHNDFKFDNVMLDENDRGRISSIFDWEMATLGDPLVDLGITLAYYAHIHLPSREGRGLIPSRLKGFLTRDELVERYARTSGLDLSRIGFYESFALFKNAVVLEQIYVRFVRGQTKDKRFAFLGAAVEPLVRMAMQVAEKTPA